MTTHIPTIPIDALNPHPKNPREDLGDLAELTASIKAQGVRQNLLAMPKADGGYYVVLGHRRLAAATLAGLTEVPCILDDTLDEAHAIELMLVENLQRADLTAIEEGDAYCALLDLGVSVSELSKTTGRNKKTVTSRVKVAKAPEKIREALKAEQLTFDGALELAAFEADHPDIFTRNTEKLNPNNWNWALKNALKEMKAAELPAKLASAGHRVVESDAFYIHRQQEVGNETSLNLSALGLEPNDHASCPGAIAYIVPWSNQPVYGCDHLEEHPQEIEAFRAEAIARRDSWQKDSEARQKRYEEEQTAREEMFARVHQPFIDAHTSRRTWIIDQLTSSDNPEILPAIAKVASDMHSVLDFYVDEWELELEGSFRHCWRDTDFEDATAAAKSLTPMGFAVAAALAPVEGLASHRWLSDAMACEGFDEGDDPIYHIFSAYTEALESAGYPLSKEDRQLVDEAKTRYESLRAIRDELLGAANDPSPVEDDVYEMADPPMPSASSAVTAQA